MTINVTKEPINLREKLNELDFDKVPFQKMPAGSVVRVERYEIPYVSTASGSTKIVAQTNVFNKLLESSKLLINISVGYSNTDKTSDDDNSALFFKNNTTGVYINDRTVYNEGDAFWAIDTNNVYGNTASATHYQYHGYTLNVVLEDNVATSGANTYTLRMSAQHSTLALGRWFTGSITITEIAQ